LRRFWLFDGQTAFSDGPFGHNQGVLCGIAANSWGRPWPNLGFFAFCHYRNFGCLIANFYLLLISASSDKPGLNSNVDVAPEDEA
jgi:hypothetical protein